MTPQRFLLLVSLGTLAAFGQTPPAKSEVGIFRQGFYWILDVNGDKQMILPPDIGLPFGGITGDIPIAGDWNGDGFTEVGIYRPSNGLFVLDTNGNGQLDAEDQVFSFWPGGLAGAIPVVGDWNGDGRTKVGLFNAGYQWILDYNGDGVYEAGIDKVYYYGGIAGDIPVVGDWTGTGISKIGIFRPSSNGTTWLLDANGDGVFGGADYFYYYGSVGDVPVVGDWNGSGTSKIGLFRYGSQWILDSNGDGVYEAGDSVSTYGGVSGDVPVVGKWNASEQSTDTQPVCVSSSGSCTATPQGQALPVMNTSVVSTPPPAPNPPYFLLTTQFIAQSTNANVASTVAGGQILVNVDTTTPPAALNGCYITWSVPLAVNSIAMPDAAAPAAESTGFGAGYTQFVYDNNCGVVGSGSSLTSSTTSNTSNGVTTYTATFTVTLALYFQPGFSGPHAVYASGMTTGGTPSPWINLGTLGIQPPPAMPAITTLAPQYVTLAPSASNTQIPLAYLGFNTSSSSDPITLSAAPVPDGNGNFLSATFQQSPATGSTTMTMSASANMRPGSYTMIVMGRDTTTGATSSRDVSATITSSPTLFISSDGVPVYVTTIPANANCTGGDSTFSAFSQPDPFLAGYNDWYGYSIGGGQNRYQLICGSYVTYNVNILTPEPPLIDSVGNQGTTLGFNNATAAVDGSGTFQITGEALTANGQTPQPAITSDDPNITFSLLSALDNKVVVNYTIGPNVTPGVHPLILTTGAGTDDSNGRFTVGDATPVLYSISPSVFVAGQTYTNVTISGFHLGTNCITPTFSGAGNTVFTTDCTQFGDTQIVGTVVVPANAPATNSASVSVNVSGYNGLAFAPQNGAQSSAQLNNIQITYYTGAPQVFVTGQPNNPSQQQVLPGQTLYITADPNSGAPVMPQISAQFPVVTGVTVGWALQVTYTRPGSGHQVDTAYFPSYGPQQDILATSTPFVPTYGNVFQGGSATLNWTYYGTNPPTTGQFYFTIGGQNPHPSLIYNRLFSPEVTGAWFLPQLVAWESWRYSDGARWVQFKVNGQPLWGQDPQGPGGFGLMQLTNTPVPSSIDLWSWQQNIDDGKAKVDQYGFDSYSFWDKQIAQWTAWNNTNHSQVSLPPDYNDGACTFTAATEYSTVTSPNPHPYEDALWVQQYNGIFPNYYEYFLKGSWFRTASPYVTNVCNSSAQQPQP